MSARDSVFQVIRENGRTYHSFAAGSYLLPNDSPEMERLILTHHIIYALLGKRLYLAPLQNPREIRDIGTGAGTWVIEMAKKFPGAHVQGSDISPMQTECDLPNVHWIIEDASQPDWGSRRYDFIHTSMLFGAFTDFRQIIQRAYDYLQPGGWFESKEAYTSVFCDDGTLDRETNAFVDYTRRLDEAMMHIGKPIRIANKLKKWYQEAGFVDVHEEVFKIPINGWPKDPRFKFIGRFWKDSLMQGLQGIVLAPFVRVLGWSMDELEVYLVPVRQAIQDRNVHAYHKFYVVWGRKPTVQEMNARNAAQSTSQAPPSSHGGSHYSAS